MPAATNEGQHESIITDELANRGLATRHKRKALGVRRDDHVYLPTPVLRCATCGRPLRGKLLELGLEWVEAL